MEIISTSLLWSISLNRVFVSNLRNDHDVFTTVLKVLRILHTSLGEQYGIQIEKNKIPDHNENLYDETSE